MASEFLEILSPSAKAELEAIMPLVKELADNIKQINNFKASGSPSGADKNIKGMTDGYKQQGDSIEKVRKELQKLSDAEKDAASKKKASINSIWDAYEKGQKKEKELSDKTTANEIANAEKVAKEEIEKNNKIIQAAEKRAQKEKEIEDRKNASILASQQKAIERQAKIDAKYSRTGSSSVIPGMAQKISDLKETEKSVLANEKLNRAYVQLTNSREQAKNKLQDLIASEKASNAEIRKAQREFDILNRKVASADKAVGRFSDANRKINGLANGVTNLMGAFGITTGVYLFANIVKDIYQTTKELQSLDLALKMVSGSTQEFAENQAFITKTAEKWGIEIKGLTQQYTQFYTASKGILSNEDIKGVFEGIAKSGALMGLSVEKQSAAFYAFEQMMSKGIVTSEELKKQLGNAMPGAIRAAAMAYQDLHPKITRIQDAERLLLKEMKQGAIDSATYVPLIVKNFEKLYGIEMVNKVETLQASQERMANSWTDLIRSLNESETGGISKFFSFVIDGLQDIIKDLTRANTSWKELNEIAKGQGRESGQRIFKERISFLGGGEGDAKAINTTASKEYKRIQEEIIKNSHIIMRFENNAFKAARQTGFDKDHFLKIKENLYKSRAEQGAIIKASQEYIYNLDKKPSKVNKKLSEEETESQNEALKKKKKAAEEAKKLEEERLKQIYENKVAELELNKQVIEQTLNDDDTYYTTRLLALEKYTNTEIEIVNLGYDEGLRLAGENQEKKKAVMLKYQKETLDVLYKYEKEKAKLEALALNPAEAVKLSNNSEELAKVSENVLDKIKNDAESAKNIKEAVKDAKKEIDDFVKSFSDDFIQQSGMTALFDIVNGRLDTFGDNWKAKTLLIMEATQEMYNFINQASEQNFKKEYDRLEQQYNISTAFAGDSAEAKKNIDKQYEKEKIKIANREAKAKKEQAIVNIAIDTAQAIIGLWAKPGFPAAIPLAIAVGAIGAAQIAIVQSQQVPQYWKGTDNADAGWAFTQEKGQEIITDKKGNVKDLGDGKGARLTMMESGDKVYNAEKTKKMLFNKDLNNILFFNGINNSQESKNTNGITKDDIQSLGNGIVHAIRNKREFSLNIDKKGLNVSIIEGNTRRTILNNEINHKGTNT